MFILVVLIFVPPVRITNIPQNIFFILLLFLSIYSLVKAFGKYEILTVVLIAFFLRIIFYFTCAHDVLPWNDFALYIDAAFSLHKGDLSLIRSFKDTFPYLQSFICWESIIAALFGENLTIFHILDCLYTSAICAIIYYIAKRIDKEVGLISAVLFAIWPSNIMFSSILSCQHIATLVYLSSLYVLIRGHERERSAKEEYLYHIAVGLLLGLGQLFHSISSVILIAVLMTMIFTVVKKEKFIRSITCMLLVIISYLLLVTTFDYYAYVKGYRDTWPVENDLNYKFAIGLNLPDISGKSNSTIRGEYFALDENGRKEYIQEIIKTNIKMPRQTFERFMDKLKTQWTGYDRPYYYLYTGEIESLKEVVESGSATSQQKGRYYVLQTLEKPFNNFDGTYQGIILVLCLIGCIASIKRKNTLLYPLMNWVLLGYIGVHILIEHQARYRYFGMPFIFIYAALGIEFICGFFVRTKDSFVQLKNYYTKSNYSETR